MILILAINLLGVSKDFIWERFTKGSQQTTVTASRLVLKTFTKSQGNYC